jgi:hypothetical protein
MKDSDREQAVQLAREVSQFLRAPKAMRERNGAMRLAVSSSEAVEMYNTMAEALGQKPVKKFESHNAAVTRIAAVLGEFATHISYDAASDTEQEGNNMNNQSEAAEIEAEADAGEGEPQPRSGKKTRAAKPRQAKNGASREGNKRNKFAGHRLYSKCEANPRRAGSIGHGSHELILKNPGMTYEEFLEKGGVPAALQWDVEKDLVRIEKVDD